MKSSIFKVKEINLTELASIVQGEIVSFFDYTMRITGTCAIDNYIPNKVSFVRSQKYVECLSGLQNAIVLIPEDLVEYCGKYPQNVYVLVDNISKALMDIQDFFYQNFFDMVKVGVSDTAKIDGSAKIGKAVYIGENVYIGKDVIIGDSTRIMHNVCIYDNVTIGNDCIIHAGTVIGTDGFRYEQDIERKIVRKMLHVGGVVIGDRVEIGANCGIDRATFEHESTIISDDVKIDNLVHIAHNARIGARTLIVTLSCVGGSAKIGEDVWIGIGVSIADNLTIGDRVKVLLNAVVAYDVKDDEVVSGFYAMPHKKWKQLWKGWIGED